MKLINFILITLMISTLNAQDQKNNDHTIYQFKVTSLEGEEFDFSSLQGKKIMIVNTASKCGLTPPIQATTSIVRKIRRQRFCNYWFPSK